MLGICRCVPTWAVQTSFPRNIYRTESVLPFGLLRSVMYLISTLKPVKQLHCFVKSWSLQPQINICGHKIQQILYIHFKLSKSYLCLLKILSLIFPPFFWEHHHRLAKSDQLASTSRSQHYHFDHLIAPSIQVIDLFELFLKFSLKCEIATRKLVMVPNRKKMFYMTVHSVTHTIVYNTFVKCRMLDIHALTGLWRIKRGWCFWLRNSYII